MSEIPAWCQHPPCCPGPGGCQPCYLAAAGRSSVHARRRKRRARQAARLRKQINRRRGRLT